MSDLKKKTKEQHKMISILSNAGKKQTKKTNSKTQESIRVKIKINKRWEGNRRVKLTTS